LIKPNKNVPQNFKQARNYVYFSKNTSKILKFLKEKKGLNPGRFFNLHANLLITCKKTLLFCKNIAI